MMQENRLKQYNTNTLSSSIPLLTRAQLLRISKQFSKEIKQKLNGKSSSLPCIIHPIDPPKLEKKSGYTVVIGGSNGMCARWSVRNERMRLYHKKKFRVPRYISNQFIQSTLLDCVNSEKRGDIGLNFAYGLEPVLRGGVLDGVLARDSKEARFSDGLIGSVVGKKFEEDFNANTNKKKLVTVANDTICLLLAVRSRIKSAVTKPLIAGIVGTGVNFAFFTKKSTVHLEKGNVALQGKGKYVAVNVESGHFSKVPQTKWDKIIDQGSSKPGSFLAEKQISGAYLHHIYNRIIEKHGMPTISEAADIDWIARDKTHEGHMLADVILERSAQLVAMQLVGILDFFGIKQGAFPIVIEGSVFWKGYRYKKRVAYWLKELLPKVEIQFEHVSQSNLIGGAMLALTI